MTDRELLELAAKAFWGDEIDDVCSIEWDEAEQCIAYTHADNQDHNGCDRTFLWNPLTDDGDALRLAVKLRIAVDFYERQQKTECACAAWVSGASGGAEHEELGDDPYAATRRAIVRAAAEIGKQMESQKK